MILPDSVTNLLLIFCKHADHLMSPRVHLLLFGEGGFHDVKLGRGDPGRVILLGHIDDYYTLEFYTHKFS